MRNSKGSALAPLCSAAVCIGASCDCADGAIIPRDAGWMVPACVGLPSGAPQGGPWSGASSLGAWRVRLFGEPVSRVARVEGEIGKWRAGAATDFRSMFSARVGDARVGWGRIGNPWGEAFPTPVEIAWQDTPDRGIQVGHAPAAGPLVLLGIAALLGGPRQGRAARGPGGAGRT